MAMYLVPHTTAKPTAAQRRQSGLLKLLGLLAGLYWLAPAMANTSELIALHVPNAQLVGEGRMKVLFWNVYDAKLYAPEAHWSPEAPFALSLTYLRDIEGEEIARRSIEAMRQQGFQDEEILSRWYLTLRETFPDVSATSTIIGIQNAARGTIFYHNNELLGQMDEPLFTQAFFNIWFSENTSEPAMRSQLTGMK